MIENSIDQHKGRKEKLSSKPGGTLGISLILANEWRHRASVNGLMESRTSSSTVFKAKLYWNGQETYAKSPKNTRRIEFTFSSRSFSIMLDHGPRIGIILTSTSRRRL